MTRTLPAIVCVLALVTGAAFAADLPNPTTTPGIVLTVDLAKICRPGYPATVRPPAAYTNRLKRQQLASSADKNPRHFEEDHLVSLELGGDPRDPRNLWPQSRVSSPWNAAAKDRIENWLHRAVCARRLPLATAQAQIAKDWIAAYRQYLGQP